MAKLVMLSEVAPKMGRPITVADIRLSPPNHLMTLLNWGSIGRMLADVTLHRREWLVPSVIFCDTHTAKVLAIHARAVTCKSHKQGKCGRGRGK
ncbi:hypothetical protein LSAT2_008464 [Lamellibrachia satsuma]|nr:hypothetical protein LSAT2_008464 [Lamellibrachia satsuma]